MKGPLQQPEGDGVALGFWRKARRLRGVALLEVLVALLLLAIVLLTAVTIRFTLVREDLYYLADLSGGALMRQAGMDFQAGVITNDFSTNLNTETGEDARLAGQLTTNTTLMIRKMEFDLSVEDEKGQERIGLYGSRNQILPLYDEDLFPRPVPPAPALSMESTTLELQLLCKTGEEHKGTVEISGGSAGTNVTSPYPFGSSVNIIARPAGGYTFSQWTGDIDSVGVATTTNTSIYLDEDKQVTAEFAP